MIDIIYNRCLSSRPNHLYSICSLCGNSEVIFGFKIGHWADTSQIFVPTIPKMHEN